MRESKAFQRKFELPASFTEAIRTQLQVRGYSLTQPGKIADAIIRLSTMYVEKPEAATPWHETWAQVASLAYFFPLNYARNRAVAMEAERLGFFRGLTRYHDFGSGTGSALFAFGESLKNNADVKMFAHDIDAQSLKLAELLKPEDFASYTQSDSFQGPKDPQGTLLSASYVLTELAELPAEWLRFEALAIIEPSTRLDGRKLLETRNQLISAGYRIWAPCTHEKDCPMLVNSERDWCHDRIHWSPPTWLEAIERLLPMKNRTLTYSYLLARREAPPTQIASLARLTGDMLVEKGKTRQSVCRSPEREFLSWFPQRMKPSGLDLQRGNLIEMKGEFPLKGTELRISTAESIEQIPPLKKF